MWYTGQPANVLGRLDPATGQFKEFPLPTPQSGPHGLVADADGSIWYTGNTAGLIGKLAPETGEVTEYRMPDAAARDPHTPIFDARGILWFTVQNGNFVGRLDPASGSIELAKVATPNARPYGIEISSKGTPFFALFGTNKLGSIDPATLKITEYTLPDPAARPRRIAIAGDDRVYYTDYARGRLGWLDPVSGSVEEIASPGGSGSRPYAIAVSGVGAVWYVETGTQQNALVRFDPGTKQLQSWPIPGGGGVVRHMVAGPGNELWLAESGVGKISRVRFRASGPTS